MSGCACGVGESLGVIYVLCYSVKQSLSNGRGSWVMGTSRGSWVWVWVKVAGVGNDKKLIFNHY